MILAMPYGIYRMCQIEEHLRRITKVKPLGFFFHQNNDPWAHAPPWAVELREMVRLVLNKENIIMSNLDDDLAEVTAQGTRLDSINTLIVTLNQRIADALSGTTLPPAVQAKVDAVFAGLQANGAKIDTALNANVPPPAPTPAPTPPAA
jgi:hypothetical protein